MQEPDDDQKAVLELLKDAVDITDPDAPSNPALTSLYIQHKRRFREMVARATKISRGSGGIEAPTTEVFWASVLFTRIVVASKSLLSLLPDCRPREHWDFTSVASLTRNLAETYLFYFWLCEEEVSKDIRAARNILLYLHDHGTRKRIFPESVPLAFKDNDPVYEDLKRRFYENPYLKTLSPGQQKDALKGQKTPFIQDDLLQSMGVDAAQFRTMYRFLSEHTHSGPVAFYRMVEHDRGTGVETRQEKQYMILAIEAAYNTLSTAISGHLKLFPDAETRTAHLTDRQVEYNVEVAQGRLKAKNR